MSKTVHSVKLQAYNSVDLDRLSYSNGDMVYDLTNGTIRLMDGVNNGGKQLLRADLSNLSSTAALSVASIVATGTIAANTLIGSISSLQVTNALTFTPVSPTSLTTTLSSYVTGTSLTTTLSSYVTGTSLTTTLSGYATTASDALKAPLASPSFTGSLASSGVVTISNPTLSTAQGVGALVVTGGASIGDSLRVSGAVYSGGVNLKSLAIAMGAALS